MVFLPLVLLAIIQLTYAHQTNVASPAPPTWPSRFHAQIFVNRSGEVLSMLDLWYDWPAGRNLNLISSQLGLRGVLHDVEYDNHTSFYYDLGRKTCKPVTFEVGILRPDWLHGATYNGVEVVDNVTTHSYTQADGFVTYWCEAAPPHRPVRWIFFDNAQHQIMSWTEGAVLPDADWQAPPYCFTNNTEDEQGSIANRPMAGVLEEGVAGGGQEARSSATQRRFLSQHTGEAQGSAGGAAERHLGWYWRVLASKLKQ